MGKAKRPTSVTVIAWILMVRSGLSLLVLGNWLEILQPSVVVDNLIQIVFGVVVIVVSSVAILKGLNWGRVLYLCCTPVWIVYNIMRCVLLSGSPGLIIQVIQSKLGLEIAFYIVVFVFLTRPSVSAFFRSRYSDER
jgi:uncharacterized membrane protein